MTKAYKYFSSKSYDRKRPDSIKKCANITTTCLDYQATKFLSLKTKDFSMQAKDVLCHG